MGIGNSVNYRIRANQKAISGTEFDTSEDGVITTRGAYLEGGGMIVDQIHAIAGVGLYELQIDESTTVDEDRGAVMFIYPNPAHPLLVGRRIVRPYRPTDSPTADFTFSPSTGISPGDTIVFSDASDSNDLEIARWTWDWSDGSDPTTLTTAADVSHSFSAAGKYKVSLTIIASDGSGSKKSTLVFVE